MENNEIKLNLYSVLRTNKDRLQDDELMFVDFGVPFVAIDDLGACRMVFKAIQPYLETVSVDDISIVCVGEFFPDRLTGPVEGCGVRVVATAAHVVEKFKNIESKE